MSALQITPANELERLRSQRDLLALLLVCAVLVTVSVLVALYASDHARHTCNPITARPVAAINP